VWIDGGAALAARLADLEGLTHLARNADSVVRRLEAGRSERRGPRPSYEFVVETKARPARSTATQ
jgi:hypothetical protein